MKVRPWYFTLVLMTVCISFVKAQLKTSSQAYAGFGYESANNHYFSTGVEGFLETDQLLYVPSFGYVDATYNLIDQTLSLTSTYSHTSRFSLGNKLELFFPQKWNAAFTLNGIVQRVAYTSILRSPLPPTPDIVIISTTTSFFVLPGVELSTFLDGFELGCGAVVVSDLKSEHKTQVYGFLNSNPARRVSLTSYGGVLVDTKPYALAKATVSWLSEIDLEFKGTIGYARLSTVYDLDDRFFSFYREKDQWSFGGLMAYDWLPDLRVFTSLKYETNKRFAMVIVTAGLYYHP